jgi:hypothetical protein
MILGSYISIAHGIHQLHFKSPVFLVAREILSVDGGHYFSSFPCEDLCDVVVVMQTNLE